jgi:hypothetical protein
VAKKMMRRITFLISIVILASSPSFPQAQPPKPGNAAPAQEEPTPALAVPRDYRYNARGRRDPFVNPVPKPKAVAAAAAPPSSRPPGLKGVLVSQAQISGVVTSKEPSMNVVIIMAPGAKGAYFARVGDELYDAVVKRITFESVTFGLASGGDANSPREIVRKVRPKPGEDK